MKRLWLIWNDSEATGVWEGMVWNVRLLGEFDIDDALTVWLERLDPVIDCKAMSGFDWDRDHGDRPEWVDCIWGKEETGPSSGAVDVGHAAVEFFRNEIRENGIMRRLRPVTYAGDQGLAVAPEMPRHQVELTMTLGDPPQEELHGHIADMHMPTREQLEQGIRGMQATAELPEGEAGRIREWIEHRIVDAVREDAVAASSELSRIAEDPDLSPETRAVAWSMLGTQADVMSRVFNSQPQATGQDAEQQDRLMHDVDRVIRAEPVTAVVDMAGSFDDFMQGVLQAVRNEQHPFIWYPTPQRITSVEAR